MTFYQTLTAAALALGLGLGAVSYVKAEEPKEKVLLPASCATDIQELSDFCVDLSGESILLHKRGYLFRVVHLYEKSKRKYTMFEFKESDQHSLIDRVSVFKNYSPFKDCKFYNRNFSEQLIKAKKGVPKSDNNIVEAIFDAECCIVPVGYQGNGKIPVGNHGEVELSTQKNVYGNRLDLSDPEIYDAAAKKLCGALSKYDEYEQKRLDAFRAEEEKKDKKRKQQELDLLK